MKPPKQGSARHLTCEVFPLLAEGRCTKEVAEILTFHEDDRIPQEADQGETRPSNRAELTHCAVLHGIWLKNLPFRQAVRRNLATATTCVECRA
jgi:hypothetical protein